MQQKAGWSKNPRTMFKNLWRRRDRKMCVIIDYDAAAEANPAKKGWLEYIRQKVFIDNVVAKTL